MSRFTVCSFSSQVHCCQNSQTEAPVWFALFFFCHFAFAQSVFLVFCLCIVYFISYPKKTGSYNITRPFQEKTLTSKGWCSQAHPIIRHSERRKKRFLFRTVCKGSENKPATMNCNLVHSFTEHSNRSSKVTSMTADTSYPTTQTLQLFIW